MALARDKAHDSIKISDAGKAYLPRPEMAVARTAFFAKRLWPWQLNGRISPRPAAGQAFQYLAADRFSSSKGVDLAPAARARARRKFSGA